MSIGKPYHRNPRQISKKRYRRLEDTLARLGDLSGIVHNLETDEIIGGNQRVSVFDNGTVELVEQFEEPDEQGTVGLGFIIWKGKPYSYRQVRWDEDTAAEANIEANLGGGDWDFEIFANQWDSLELIERGFDEDLLKGWQANTFALGDLLASENGKDETPETPPQIDRAEELRQKWGVESGQLWQLKKHRLICGDCTDRAVVERVMGNDKAVLFATDPPYGANAGNIGYTAQRDDIEVITKDDLEGEEMQAFLERAFSSCIPYLEDNCAWYLWHPMLTQGYFAAAAAAAAAANLIIHRQIIWVKEQFIFGRGDYHWRHELCFYGWRQGNRPKWYTERNQDTIWIIPYDGKRSEIGHPTAKPIELFAKPLRNHTKEGDIALEPFCGSGSQIIACENLNRRCRAIEIDPGYVAVSLQRWADHTGNQPQLLNT